MNTHIKKPLPLDGLLVVSLEQAIAAPFLTRQLADLGARVIKVERPDGGDFARAYDQRAAGMSSHFVWVNRGKQSVVLDLKLARDIEVVKAMALQADVFVQNLAPGASERMGLGHGTLMQANRRYCCGHVRLFERAGSAAATRQNGRGIPY